MKSAIYVSGLIAMLIFGTAAYGQQKPEQFYRVQIISVPTVTLTTQQFLTGDANGKPAPWRENYACPDRPPNKLENFRQSYWFQVLAAPTPVMNAGRASLPASESQHSSSTVLPAVAY